MTEMSTVFPLISLQNSFPLQEFPVVQRRLQGIPWVEVVRRLAGGEARIRRLSSTVAFQNCGLCLCRSGDLRHWRDCPCKPGEGSNA